MLLRTKKTLWDHAAWSPFEIAPELRRLVMRPILVLPLAKYGSAPIESAKKTTMVVNGAGALWVPTPFGPAMKFTNAVPGTPTDWLSPRSAYPATSAAMVPHSVALLYSTSNTAITNVPFCTDNSGSGLIFFCGGGLLFSVVHGGVVGFSAIGTPVANTYFLQLYSYDLVTMNHMVVNLSNGAVASQAIAETRALSTGGSTTHRVASKGANECLQGNVVGVAWVRGAWTLPEMALIARNPVGLWTPDTRTKRRIAYAPPPSGTTFSYTGTGGVSTGGAVAWASARSFTGAGGVSAGGAAAIVRTNTYSGAGGVQSGGTATLATRRSFTTAGGVSTSGAAPWASWRKYAGAGGVQSGGVAGFVYTPAGVFNYTGTGGVSTGGVGAWKHTSRYTGAGGVATGGTATRSTVARFGGLGGAQIGGVGAWSSVRTYTGVGGAQLGGAATLTRVALFVGAGGVVTGGAAVVFFAPAGVMLDWLTPLAITLDDERIGITLDAHALRITLDGNPSPLAQLIRQRLGMPSTTPIFECTAGDRLKSITGVIDGLDVATFAACTYKFNMRKKTNGRVVIDDAAAAKVGSDVDKRVGYNWQPGDTDQPGEYVAAFWAEVAGVGANIPNGKVKILVVITPPVGAAP